MTATEILDIDVAEPLQGSPSGKNLLSMHQLKADDIWEYIEEAHVAESLAQDPTRRGISLVPSAILKAVMRQPSTRTGGSMTTAMRKLGGDAELISGMESSSEAKGESLADSWVAFASQSDIIGTRTSEEEGPHFAAKSIAMAFQTGQLWQKVPVINLGDGRNEHPTQALGDLYTIRKSLGDNFENHTMAVVGDHERYRAHHSLLIGAAAMKMNVIVVQTDVAPVPEEISELLGNKLSVTSDLDSAMQTADVLYMGRNPDEYDGKEPTEIARSEELADAYRNWIIDHARLQQMKPTAIVMHPRPRRDELHPSVDVDQRMRDVEQMENMIPMRMAIIARHLGVSIIEGAAKR